MAHHHRYRTRRQTPGGPCQQRGCTHGVAEHYTYPGGEPAGWYCWQHASEHGFCPGCASFVLGSPDDATLDATGMCRQCLEENNDQKDDFDDYLDRDYEHDEFEEAIANCSQLPDGSCLAAGSEQCEFECPLRE